MKSLILFLIEKMLDLTSANHKVWWEDGQLPFDHIPFVQVNHRVYDCRHGVDRHSSQKKKNRTVIDIIHLLMQYYRFNKSKMKVKRRC